MDDSNQVNDPTLAFTIAHSLLTHQKAALLWADAELRLGYVTAKAANLLEMPVPKSGELLTHFFYELVGLESVLQEIAHGRQQNFSLEFIHRDTVAGGQRYISFSAYPAPTQEGHPGVLLVLEDSTHMGELIQELRQKRNELRLLRERMQEGR